MGAPVPATARDIFCARAWSAAAHDPAASLLGGALCGQAKGNVSCPPKAYFASARSALISALL